MAKVITFFNGFFIASIAQHTEKQLGITEIQYDPCPSPVSWTLFPKHDIRQGLYQNISCNVMLKIVQIFVVGKGGIKKSTTVQTQEFPV